jgi:hypothetical protein
MNKLITTLCSDSKENHNTPFQSIKTDWHLPIQGIDILKAIDVLMSKKGYKLQNQIKNIAILASAKTIRGAEYAASSISFLPDSNITITKKAILEMIASFELFRHGANILDDFTDNEIRRNEYRNITGKKLSKADLLIIQSVFHFVGISMLIAIQDQEKFFLKNKNFSKSLDVNQIFAFIYNGWRKKNYYADQRMIWDEFNDPIRSYWERHVAISTAYFYQIPFTLTGTIGKLDRKSRLMLSKIGYSLGEIIHAKNDLQDLALDIKTGDFSYPIIRGVQNKIINIT